MSLTLFNKDLDIIAKLEDEPNDVGGLGAAQLKAKFDEAGNIIKDYINKTLIPEIESGIDSAAQGVGTGDGIDGSKLLNDSVPTDKIKNLDGAKISDGTLTTSKHAKGSITRELLAENAKTLQTEDFPNKVVPNRALADDAVTTGKIKNEAVTFAKLANDAKPLSFQQKTVDVSAWTEDNVYKDFPYKASVSCAGVTEKYFPMVIYSAPDAISGNFAPVAETYSGGVYIYAASKPTAAVTIPNIVCLPLT